jgi:hypothetical protein
MVHKDSPKSAVDTISTVVQKKEDEIAKAEEEERVNKTEKESSPAEIVEEDKDKEPSESKNGQTKSSDEITQEAIRLASAAILSLVQTGLQKQMEFSDLAKIEVQDVKTKPIKTDRKNNDLVVEVEQ